MQERHINRERYFKEQSQTTKKYVIPYISEIKPVTATTRILEIGCGEGGNLLPFIEMGCHVVGVDILENKIANAKEFYKNHPQKDHVTFIAEDIYKLSGTEEFSFDLIIMRDTIEHIPDQGRFLEHVKSFLQIEGVIFFAFPPWRMPFGGHQQICHHKYLSKLPYFHILPEIFYKSILRFFGEAEVTIQDLIDIKNTRLSIATFHKILKNRGFQIKKQDYYLINPNYEVKFGLQPKKLPGFLAIPLIKDFYTTAVYCIVSKQT